MTVLILTKFYKASEEVSLRPVSFGGSDPKWNDSGNPDLQREMEHLSYTGADPGFCEGGFEGGFVNSLKGTFEQK